MPNSSSSSFLSPSHCVVPVKWLNQLIERAYGPRDEASTPRAPHELARDQESAAAEEILRDVDLRPATDNIPPDMMPSPVVPDGYRPAGRLKPKDHTIVASMEGGTVQP